jgi:quercetin dioxygenase-like cupin family protein
MERNMPKMDNSDVPSFDLIPGVIFTPVAAPSRGTTENAVWRTRVEPHQTGALHHMTREEIIVGLSGAAEIRLDGERHRLAPGDAFAVPAFTDFVLECAGDVPFEAMVVLPAGGRAVIGGQPSFQPAWSV